MAAKKKINKTIREAIYGMLDHIRGHAGFADDYLISDDPQKVIEQAEEIEGWAQGIADEARKALK